MAQLEYEIQQHLALLRPDARVRVKQWLQKLRQEVLILPSHLASYLSGRIAKLARH